MTSKPRIRLLGTSLSAQSAFLSAAIVATAIFTACLFGIWTRPVGFLATFWPANALMLGLLIRLPALAGPAGWLAGAAGFMAADLSTGSPLGKALVLNGANLAGIATAYLVYMRSPTGQSDLHQPASMLYLLLAAAAGGATAGLVGAVINPLLFDGGALNGWAFWFATEFVNYVAILPVILSAPSWSNLRKRLLQSPVLRKADIPPAAALAVSFSAASLIGGPGAIVFPVPALLWCGLVYPIFPTAVLTLISGTWALIFISTSEFLFQMHDKMAIVSLRLGISLIAVTPIMLACVMQNRNDLIARLRDLATRDPLTGIANRKAFRDTAQTLLEQATQPTALLMFDLDHFKDVNDTYGHAAGDKVLVAFTERVRERLRANDVFGRLGGEEFAAVVPNCNEDQIVSLAERIRLASRMPVKLDDGRSVAFTTSIGMTIGNPVAGPLSLDAMLHVADDMLYRAKGAGRDRAELSALSATPPPTGILGAPCAAAVHAVQT